MKRPELDDLIRDAKKDAPDPDWKSIDEKLFARIEREPVPVASSDEDGEDTSRGGRVVWIGAAFTLAAAAAALLLVHPSKDDGDVRTQVAQSAGALVGGDVAIGSHANAAHVGTQLAQGDRIDVVDQVAYFESPGAVRWAAQNGSVVRVEHAASPLVLSLEKGAAEAQVTPVPSGEAFAVDVTSSSGSVVRVAVHGTHLRVARDGDKITVDLTEGVVSIGAPPRRGSTIGTLVTAPAHVELDARDLSSLRVDHAVDAVRVAERVVPAPHVEAETAINTPLPTTFAHDTVDMSSHAETRPQTQTQTQKAQPAQATNANVAVAQSWLASADDIALAISACGKEAVAPQTTFTTSLALQVGDDGFVQSARFTPPLLPEARDCAANIIYKRTKLGEAGALTVPIQIRH